MSAIPKHSEEPQLEPEEMQASAEIAQPDQKALLHEKRIRRYRYLLPVLILIAFFTWSFTTNLIPSESMLPTLKPGDHILTMRSWIAYIGGRAPSRGDIVVFAFPSNLPDLDNIGPDDEKRRISETQQEQLNIPAGSLRHVKGDILIKRVVGLPGETIQLKGHDVFINGKKLPHSYFANLGTPDPVVYYNFAVEEPLKLKDDEVFVLGDNFANSEDGRFWGPLKRRNIVGRFVRVLWNDGRTHAETGGETKPVPTP